MVINYAACFSWLYKFSYKMPYKTFVLVINYLYACKEKVNAEFKLSASREKLKKRY
jgi:hypothetical protein